MDFYTNVRLYGKNILYRGVENGKRIARRVEYRPTFFVPSNKKSKYKTLAGQNVEPIEPGNINDAREFLERYKNVDTFPIYGNNRYEYTYISDQFPDEVLWDKSNLLIAYLDIEVASDNGFPEPMEAAEEVLCITVRMDRKFFTFGVGDYVPHREDVEYTRCKDEIDLLRKFLGFWSLHYPDIISGWNVKLFDIPYLINRMMRVLGDKEANLISPWKKFRDRKVFIMNREYQAYEIFGIAILDYFDLFKKYSPVASQESYRLDHIASVEGVGKKIDYSEYETLHQLYKQNFQKYVEYNIHDTDLVERIENEGVNSSKLIELALTLAYDNKCNYEDVFAQVRMWDSIIFNHLKKKNIVIPQIHQGDKDSSYEGAYVKEPIPGVYDWVVSFDLNSLYPHLIMQYNISPETLLEPDQYTDAMRAIREQINVDALLNKQVDLDELKDLNVTVTANKQFYTTAKHGFLPEIMSSMYEDRKRYKKMAIEAKKKLETVKDDPNQTLFVKREIARYNNLQQAKKVSLNSAYGAIGNQYFRFFDIRNAEAITLGGQLSYKWIEQHINEYLNGLLKTTGVDYVIAGDTDSMYLNLSGIVQKFLPNVTDKSKIVNLLDKVCEDKIQKFIDATYQELADYVNAYEQKMQMKRENICDRAIWTAKKRYILNVWDSEGVRYEKPKIKIVGLEAIKSSTPAVCRTKIKDAIKVILEQDNDAVIKFIDDFREEFKKLPVEEIAFPRSVNNIEKNHDASQIFKPGCPMHVKAALVYNHLLKQKKLTKRYQAIKGGEKIKYCYLKMPNPYNSSAIAFITTLPKEVDMHDMIDYDEQFEGAFLSPLKTILNCIGWKVEHVATLDAFFA